MGENSDNRVYNFSAGPCTLPLEVLEEVQAELVDYHGMGMSLLEMSHRGPIFEPIYQETRELALSLWEAPDDFDVLFLQGGASGQFSMVPMNLLQGEAQGAYINTGHWVKIAMLDAQTSGKFMKPGRVRAKRSAAPRIAMKFSYVITLAMYTYAQMKLSVACVFPNSLI